MSTAESLDPGDNSDHIPIDVNGFLTSGKRTTEEL